MPTIKLQGLIEPNTSNTLELQSAGPGAPPRPARTSGARMTLARTAAPVDEAAERRQAVRDALLVRMLSVPVLTARSLGEIHDLARIAAAEICEREHSASWGSADHTGIASLHERARLGSGVRIVAHIAELPAPRVWQVEDGRTVVGTVLTLRGADGDTITTLGIVGDEAIARLRALRSRGAIEFLGRAVLVPSPPAGARSTFALEVLAARQSSSALDAMGATKKERQDTETLLREIHAASRSPLDHLQQEVVRGLGIVGLDDLPVLRSLLRFTVLQAVSVGRIGQAPAKLHAIIVGPPAQGKKLVGLAARALNHTWTEASPSKISPAGLVGSSSHAATGWKSEAGLLPQADGGVLHLQDAHAIPAARIRQIAPILQELVEDGVLRDSVAGGQRREVSAGLLIDLNRLGQVSTSAKTAPTDEAPILGIRPLLSRVDLIAEIQPDPKRAWETSALLYGSLGKATAARASGDWIRRAQLVVAALRDRHPDIDIYPVVEQMRAFHERIAADNAETIAAMPEAGDIPMRLAVSFARLVTASARANDRGIATAADVEEAGRFLTSKLEFLKFSVTESDVGTPRNGLERIRAAVVERYGRGRRFREEDLIKIYFDVTGHRAGERTARRWITDLGAKRVCKGSYVLPVVQAENGKP